MPMYEAKMKVIKVSIALVLMSLVGFCEGLCRQPPWVSNNKTIANGDIVKYNYTCSEGLRHKQVITHIQCLSNGSWTSPNFICGERLMPKCGLHGFHLLFCEYSACCDLVIPRENCYCVFVLSIGAIVGTVTAGIYIICIIIGAIIVLLRHYAKSPDNYFHPDYRMPVVRYTLQMKKN